MDKWREVNGCKWAEYTYQDSREFYEKDWKAMKAPALKYDKIGLRLRKTFERLIFNESSMVEWSNIHQKDKHKKTD